MKPRLSIIIPAYNEAENFNRGLLEPAFKYLQKVKYPYEVIFVNDGSTDATGKLLTGFCRAHSNCRLMTISHGGKAAAVTAGMLSAKGDYALFTDFDQSTPLYEADNLLRAHDDGAGVAIGLRGVKEDTKQDTIFRKIRSYAFVLLVQIVLLPGIRDTQCGFKSFKNTLAKRIFTNLKVTNSANVTGGYMGAFDVEALFLAGKLKAKIAQVPVSWIKIDSTRLNIWKEPLQMALDTFKVRLFDLLGRYNDV